MILIEGTMMRSSIEIVSFLNQVCWDNDESLSGDNDESFSGDNDESGEWEE